MSIGQRIGQKRREAGLSQEALGEQMGVSRQAIYKWESDTALPEIEKLIALAGLFEVSVGWLLGVEEKAPEESIPQELNQTQLDMVTEIVDRYIRQLPQPKKRKWPKIVAALVLLAVGIGFGSRLDQIESQYLNLQNSMNMISHSVNSQIGGITGRVEEILKAQNSLTAEYSTRIVSTDYAAGTVTIAMEAVPKTQLPGMTAVFVVDCGSGTREFPGELKDGRAFTCEATAPLTDSITVSAVFVQSDGTRQNQLLDNYASLLSSSYAEVSFRDDSLWNLPVTDGEVTLSGLYIVAEPRSNEDTGTTITECKVGIFRNKRLIAWAQPCEKPNHYVGYNDGEQFYRLPELVIGNLTAEDRLCVAALVTDSYGRQYMWNEFDYIVSTDADGVSDLTYATYSYLDCDLANWSFE